MGEDDSPEAEFARIQRRGAWRSARGATATWAAVLAFLAATALVMVPYVFVIGPLLGTRPLTQLVFVGACAVGASAALAVRRRLEPKHPEEE
jgi:hypothetical protein